MLLYIRLLFACIVWYNKARKKLTTIFWFSELFSLLSSGIEVLNPEVFLQIRDDPCILIALG